jgi:hypothetical protein
MSLKPVYRKRKGDDEESQEEEEEAADNNNNNNDNDNDNNDNDNNGLEEADCDNGGEESVSYEININNYYLNMRRFSSVVERITSTC